MRKLWVSWVGLLLLVFSIVGGCSLPPHKNSAKSWMQDNGKIKILATTAQIGDLVAWVGGERVECFVLIQGELDPHSYELVKGDDDKIHYAQLIFYNGLGLEHGASLSQLLHTQQKAYGVCDAIRAAHPEKILWRDSQVDPHLWMDISLWETAVFFIYEQLARIDPAGEGLYRAQAERLSEMMLGAHDEVFDLLQRVDARQRYLVTSHDAFQYFVRAYFAETGELNWSERLAAPEGLAPEGQLNPVDLQRTVDFLRQHQVRTLFPESNVSPDSIRKIVTAAQEMGMQVQLCREPLYGDSLGQGSPDAFRYLEAMRHNARVIAVSLGGSDE